MNDDPQRQASQTPSSPASNPGSSAGRRPTGRYRDLIVSHVTARIGAPSVVFNEILSDDLRIDIHVVPPTPQRNFFTLFTTGMSDHPMQTPPGAEHFALAELLICLPPDWKLSEDALKEESNYWPLRWLKILARLPHQNDSWLWIGHTIPNGDPPAPFASNTRLCSMLLAPPVCFDESSTVIPVDANTRIFLIGMIPLHRDEMEFKLQHGLASFGNLLDESPVTEILDISRLSILDRGQP